MGVEKFLKVLDTKVSTAAENMQFDENLLNRLDPDEMPILHLYEWAAPSATYGYFTKPEAHLNLEKAEQMRLQVAKRPTGGGIIFHIWDLAFSFFMPANHRAFSLNTLENYRFVNTAVLEAVSLFQPLDEMPSLIDETSLEKDVLQNFCMAKPTKYDVVYKGMKIAGAAQRRRRQGYLHQGSISLAIPDQRLLKEVLLLKEEVFEAMLRYSFAPLGHVWEPQVIHEARRELQNLLSQKLVEKLLLSE